MISFSSDNEFFQGKTDTFPLMRFFLELTQHIPPKGYQLTNVILYSNVSICNNIMKGIDQVAGILSKIQNKRLILDFLECLLTKNEIEEISGRWELVKMLDKGWSQRRIARELGMSLCKITRGSQELKKKNSAFKKVLDEFV